MHVFNATKIVPVKYCGCKCQIYVVYFQVTKYLNKSIDCLNWNRLTTLLLSMFHFTEPQ